MQTLSDYRSTHSDLRQMIGDLRAILTDEHLRLRSNAKNAYEQLCDLGERVNRHLTEEDREVYPGLLIHEDPKVNSMAWGFISGERPMRKTFADYHTRWLKNCDFNFGGEFLAQTQQVFAMVAQRLVREEQVLLPKLVEIGMLHEPLHRLTAPRPAI
ncbi:hemerythrin domain-containing protein [uncultured Thiodictyon sp.]|uniref:hemerythrin domain-containing protein n=1 Tax=uncultured Thiodictyon sp. TaxID=1846217 RepID=UPI0025D0FEFF|nr:hemerythrin domain-containing protein [uncultured Thiodictyon sp.]